MQIALPTHCFVHLERSVGVVDEQDVDVSRGLLKPQEAAEKVYLGNDHRKAPLSYLPHDTFQFSEQPIPSIGIEQGVLGHGHPGVI
jgi:hypothetical protein